VHARRGWYITGVTFTIELEREADGRWIAEVPALPGVLCYGHDRDEAVAGVQALALRVYCRTPREPGSARRVPQRHVPGGVSNWPATKARRVPAALMRIGWVVKRQSGSHRTLSRLDRPDFVFAFHDDEELQLQLVSTQVEGRAERGHEERVRPNCEHSRHRPHPFACNTMPRTPRKGSSRSGPQLFFFLKASLTCLLMSP
jgi:predicted RNA binding protein YcfA (HicA-like mRNA interferase family)